MCGIAGFLNPRNNDKKTEKEIYQILKKMNEVQRHRGPDDEGIFLENGCALGHVRLSILDLYRGHQPMCKKKEGNTYAIILNGEIYNMKTLKEQLIKEGEMFSTTSDTEVVLTGYIRYGISYIEELNGIFPIALWDGKRKKLYLIRDRVGVKPLFYTKRGDTLIFASEIKGLFAYPGVKPVINREGLCEIFGLGPAKSYGKGVFKDIYEVLPGHFLEYDRVHATTKVFIIHIQCRLDSRIELFTSVRDSRVINLFSIILCKQNSIFRSFLLAELNCCRNRLQLFRDIMILFDDVQNGLWFFRTIIQDLMIE